MGSQAHVSQGAHLSIFGYAHTPERLATPLAIGYLAALAALTDLPSPVHGATSIEPAILENAALPVMLKQCQGLISCLTCPLPESHQPCTPDSDSNTGHDTHCQLHAARHQLPASLYNH